MTDGPEMSRKGQRSETGRPVESLANEALKVLARKRGAGVKHLSEDLMLRLREAVLAPDFEERGQVVADFWNRGVSVEDLIDLYVPEIARRLGDEWCSDQTSFADVTIGTARLQGLLRELLRSAPVASTEEANVGVAVIVVADEYHTLGALVLTAQLRRLGVSVRLLLGATTSEVLDLVSNEDKYDAVMISASHSESLVHLGKLVEKLRKRTSRNVPIVIGGPILGTGKDVKTATGADFTTSDVVEALRLCQLKISPYAATVNTKAG